MPQRWQRRSPPMPADAAAASSRRLALLAVAAFATMVSLRVCDPMLPMLAKEFTSTTGGAARVISAFAFAYCALLLLCGPLGDRFGKLRVISFATLACAVGSLGCALSTNLDMLVGFRALSGATAAGVTPLAMAWIGDTVVYDRRQETLARLLGATTLGLIAGQVLGGFLADFVGWRSAFGLLVALFSVTGALMLRETRHGEPPAVGTGASSQAGHVQAGHVQGGHVQGGHVQGGNMQAGNVQAGYAQVGYAKLGPTKAGYATRIRALLHEPWPRRMLAVAFAEGVFVFAGLAFIPAHLHREFGLSVGWAGAVMMMYGVGGLLYSRFARVLLRRLGETGLARAGGGLLFAVFMTLAVIPAWIWAVPACLAAGLGFYMLHNTLQTHATQMAPAVRGTAVTLFSCSLFFGQSAGVMGAAWIVDHHSARVIFVVSGLALPVIAGWFAVLIDSVAPTRPSSA
jgi:predicted MFS family arabinose efflux permease